MPEETPKNFLRMWIRAYRGRDRASQAERKPYQQTLAYIEKLETDNAELRRRARAQLSPA